MLFRRRIKQLSILMFLCTACIHTELALSEAAVTKLVEKKEAVKTLEKKELNLFEQAQELYAKKEYEQASQLLVKYFKTNPDDINALSLLVDSMVEAEKYIEGLKYVEKLISKYTNPSKKALVLNRKGVLFERSGRYRDALKIFTEAYNLYPADVYQNNKLRAENKLSEFQYINKLGIEASSRSPIVINFFSAINNPSMLKLIKIIQDEVISGNNDFHINIRSMGGSMEAVIGAYNIILSLPINLTTNNIVNTSSAAIMLYCLGKKRFSHPTSYFMIHNPSLPIYNNLTPTIIKNVTEYQNTYLKSMMNIYNSCMNITPEQVDKYVTGAYEWFLNLEVATELGLVTEKEIVVLIPKRVYNIPEMGIPIPYEKAH